VKVKTGFLAMTAIAALTSSAAAFGPGQTVVHPSHMFAGALTTYSIGAHPGVGAPLATLNSSWSNTAGSFLGTIDSWVYSNATGGLTFVYQINMDVAGERLLGRATMDGDWALFTIHGVGSDGSGSGAVNGSPAWFDHDPSGVGMQFKDQLVPGALGLAPATNSALLWLDTSASLWQTGTAAFLDSGTIASGDVLVPLIPAPGAGMTALLGLAMMSRRRR
jgi:hypothetical protein